MEKRYIASVRLGEELSTDAYPGNIPAVRFLSEHELRFDSPVCFFVGENGTGKSTVTEAIAVACGFNAEGGTKNFAFSTKSTHSELCEKLIISRENREKDGFFLRAESFYNAASYIDELDEGTGALLGNYGGVSLHEQSHGESFMALIKNRFSGNGLYILDEPEAALSPRRQTALIGEIARLVRKNSQFIITTHSPLLTAFPGAQIYEFSSLGIKSVSFRETANYRLMKSFFDDPETVMSLLTGDE